jgi:hypothetical protein
MIMNIKEANNAIQKLCKWRGVFAGWQLGTRTSEDPECQAVRDHREVTMLMRAELNALTRCCIDAGLFTEETFTKQLGEEAQFLDKSYEEKFPGYSTDLDGVHMKMPEAFNTSKGWRP